MAAILKLDQIQSDTGTVNLASNLAFTGAATFVGNIANPTITGTLNLTGGGIKFPATQIASIDGNTLDDYEEGMWLPNLIGGTTAGVATWTSRESFYIKIGRFVSTYMNLRWSNHTGTGEIQIDNLPFAVQSYAGFGAISFNGGLTYSAGYYPALWANGGSTTLRFWQATNGSTTGINMDTSVGEIHVHFNYFATA